MNEIKFRRDTTFRKQFFVPESFAHPAKMDAQLLIWIVERYTKPGETILDPMAGSGTMMLACTLGRNVVLVELEDKFCKMMQDNREEVKMRPQLGYEMGKCQIKQGDARQLGGLLVDGIISSPPYRERHSYPDVERERHAVEKLKAHPDSKIGGVRIHEHCSENPENISNLPYGNVDKIITSPPYAEGGQGVGAEYHPERMVGPTTGLGRGYGENARNIGNLKSQSYLEAMLMVYQQCFKVLKDGGLMILVTKNFIRKKTVIRLDSDTINLCEQAGFKFLERHYRKLPALSFWRVLYAKKYPELKDLIKQLWYEDVLVFKR